MAELRSWDVAVERGLVDLREPLRTVQLELLALLADLSRDQWSAPTMLPGWDVHSIALHLLGSDLGRLSRAWRDRAPGAELSFEELAAQIEASNEEWVHAVARIPPPLLAELLALTAERVSALYDDVDLWAPATPVAWIGSGPSPLWLDLAREYTERWVHQAQIREAVGAAQLDYRRWLWPVLDTFMLCLPRALADVRARPGTTLDVVVKGPAGGAWHATRRADRWHLGPGPSSAPAAAVSLASDVAWRWLASLLSAESVDRTVEAEGDRRLVDAALHAVAIMTTRS